MKPGDLVTLLAEFWYGEPANGSIGVIISENNEYTTPGFRYWNVMIDNKIHAVWQKCLLEIDEAG